jgi:hypothetical protein
VGDAPVETCYGADAAATSSLLYLVGGLYRAVAVKWRSVATKHSLLRRTFLPGKLLELRLQLVLEVVECRGTSSYQSCQDCNTHKACGERTASILGLEIRKSVDLAVCLVNGSIECWASHELV